MVHCNRNLGSIHHFELSPEHEKQGHLPRRDTACSGEDISLSLTIWLMTKHFGCKMHQSFLSSYLSTLCIYGLLMWAKGCGTASFTAVGIFLVFTDLWSLKGYRKIPGMDIFHWSSLNQYNYVTIYHTTLMLLEINEVDNTNAVIPTCLQAWAAVLLHCAHRSLSARWGHQRMLCILWLGKVERQGGDVTLSKSSNQRLLFSFVFSYSGKKSGHNSV